MSTIRGFWFAWWIALLICSVLIGEALCAAICVIMFVYNVVRWMKEEGISL
jgi:hypothetical protein